MHDHARACACVTTASQPMPTLGGTAAQAEPKPPTARPAALPSASLTLLREYRGSAIARRMPMCSPHGCPQQPTGTPAQGVKARAALGNDFVQSLQEVLELRLKAMPHTVPQQYSRLLDGSHARTHARTQRPVKASAGKGSCVVCCGCIASVRCMVCSATLGARLVGHPPTCTRVKSKCFSSSAAYSPRFCIVSCTEVNRRA